MQMQTCDGKGNEQMKIGFDNDKYLKMQSEHIRERISKYQQVWKQTLSGIWRQAF